MERLIVTQGFDRDFTRQVVDAHGIPYSPTTTMSPFLSTDVLAGQVWQGGNLPVLLYPALTWVDYTIGTYQASFSASATSTLPTGLYRYQATVSRSGKIGLIDSDRIEVQISPGTDTPQISFTSLKDLTLYCPWIQDLQADPDQLAFQQEQARATQWLINALVQLYKPWASGLSPNIGHPGFNAWSMGGGASDYTSTYLRDQITPLTPGATIPANLPNRKSTTPNFINPAISTALLLRPAILEICAKKTLSYIFDTQIGKDNQREWLGLSRRFLMQADQIFMCQRFEIDYSVPQTGYASVVINGGTTNMR